MLVEFLYPLITFFLGALLGAVMGYQRGSHSEYMRVQTLRLQQIQRENDQWDERIAKLQPPPKRN